MPKKPPLRDNTPQKTKFLQDEIESAEGGLFGWAKGRAGGFQSTLHGIEGETDDPVGEGGALGFGGILATVNGPSQEPGQWMGPH